MAEVEHGYVVCKGKQGLVKGSQASGQRHSVTIPIKCPKRTSPHALVHSHPSGNPALSSQDRATGKQHSLNVCTVTRRHGVKCYRPER